MSQTVDRALTILTSLGDGPASLEQAANRIGVHKSTALRLLRTLEEHGFVQRQADHRYRLGGRLLSLAHTALEDIDVRQVCAPYLASLNERFGHTVHLAVLDGGEVLYVDKVDARYPAPPHCRPGEASRIGGRAPAAATAAGRVLLADLTDDQLATVMEDARLPVDLHSDLAAVRRQGWSLEQADYAAGVNCLAAPIKGNDGRAIAACAISVPTSVAPLGELNRLLPELLCTVEAVSLAYGGSPTPRWCDSRCGAKAATQG
ncbi:DNA-binding IclR family transcriptional regulator [Kitasatospora sp. GP30]|uniref:IclR family transcriptional regulator n=1 Tax=Kitasatospora sp. GP30 TaxID=3035084 RepID=UPI000C703838|nr:IclR family transcriptional regulator [Kitasatospora sp. GP30]MDH6143275.1 DNA-binding IclR family transcriptional regulator [Kitasatospora sp. GP30]